MSVTYEIYVMQVDRPDWLAELRRAVAAELLDIGMHRSVSVDVTETSPASSAAPAVGVVLIGPAANADPDLAMAIDAAITDGLVVIPVVDDLATFQGQAPDRVSPFNGFAWSGTEPQRTLARVLLEELGIEDSVRRVFLSHKREDGLGAAEQLHDELSQHRFCPFIDRFALRSGVHVQEHIADALEEYAFLVLLETPQAHLSDWVYDEIEYALVHTMGSLIIEWPNNPTPIPATRGLPRFVLTEDDLTIDDHGYDVFTPETIDRLLREIEAAHAHAIVRRRRALICSIEEAAVNAGGTSVALKDWSLDVTTPTGRSIVAVAPRLPAAADLQRLDQARSEIAPAADALLVHATRHLRDPARQHLEWVRGARNLAMLAENAIGGHW